MTDKQIRSFKIACIIVLVITFYLFAVNLFNYFWVQEELKSPLIPRDLVKHLWKVHLYMAGTSLICFVIGMLFYKRKNYLMAVCSCLPAIILINYFPETFL